MSGRLCVQLSFFFFFFQWAGLGPHLLPRILLIPCSLWWDNSVLPQTGGPGMTSVWSSLWTTASRFILLLSKQEGLLDVSLGVREAGFQATEPRNKSYSRVESYSRDEMTPLTWACLVSVLCKVVVPSLGVWPWLGRASLCGCKPFPRDFASLGLSLIMDFQTLTQVGGGTNLPTYLPRCMWLKCVKLSVKVSGAQMSLQCTQESQAFNHPQLLLADSHHANIIA